MPAPLIAARLLTSSEVELMETIPAHTGNAVRERLLTSSEVELMETKVMLSTESNVAELLTSSEVELMETMSSRTAPLKIFSASDFLGS